MMILPMLASLVTVPLPQLAIGGGQNDCASERPALRLHFWDGQDVHDTYGHLEFRATSLEDLGRPTGYPEDMVFSCTAPRKAGGMWVYGWSCRNAEGEFLPTNPLKVIRCWTEDGHVFHDAETVFTDTSERWLCYANIVRRRTDGRMWMFPWAETEKRPWPGHALLAYASDDGQT
jgi:hypothetical protein